MNPDTTAFVPPIQQTTPEEIAAREATWTEQERKRKAFEAERTRLLAVVGGEKNERLSERYEVGYNVWDDITVSITGDGYDDGVTLAPAEALKLFAWLQREQAMLERLAEEGAS